MKILGPREIGHGILIEYDAGSISPKHNQKILREIADPNFNGEVEMYCILQKYDVPNRNGRIYPENILRRENERYQDVIKRGGSISELNHPESSLIDLERSSHIITETFWDGNRLMGKLRMLTSPGYHKEGIVSSMGDIAANLLRQGVTLGISSRGVGSLKENGGNNEVQDDFELICFDLVSSPSTPGSYLFKNAEDVNKWDEVLESKKEPDSLDIKANKALKLMSKLNNFLSR
mgnify:CR=1 FL=1|jgi:hypothetical protein|tara:strand:+ start:2718 stop:3419 length:702 start_codon:yes stop_codon:yes gene_type:complete